MSDAWNPANECLVHIAAPRIIGGPSHHHVCRKPFDHTTVLVPSMLQAETRRHRCGCGHLW